MSWRHRKRNRFQQPSHSSCLNDNGYGQIEMTWRDGGIPACKFDKIAHSARSELLMVSLVAETQRIKAIRAALVPNPKNNSRVSIIAAGVKTGLPDAEEWYKSSPGRLNPSAEGYICHQHKLGYGLGHALFVTKAPGFMIVLSEEALWRELNNTRFTTPLLRGWMPYIERQLRAINRLEHAHVYGCRCGILTATTPCLDEIVVEGLRARDITIPRGDAGLASQRLSRDIPAIAVA